MATKRLPPPLVGGIQQATVVDEEETDAEDLDEEDEDDPAPLVFWVSWDGRVDQA